MYYIGTNIRNTRTSMMDFSFILQEKYWILHSTAFLLLTSFVHILSSKLLNHLIGKAESTRIIYDEALLKALKAPLALMIWLLGLSTGVLIILNHINGIDIHSYIELSKKIGIIVVLCWGVIRFIKNVENLYIRDCVEKSKEFDKTLAHAMTQLVTIAGIAVSLLAIMQLLGLPISGLLALSGIGGAAIAFASRDLLANLFGGLVVYLDRPFKIGDWIRSPDKQIEGTVESIGWRVTCIRTFDKRPLYVPNGVFLTISVENPSRMLNRRIKTTIGIRYQDAGKMDAITRQVKKMLTDHPEIDNQQTMIVNFVEFGPSSLNFLVYTFTKTTQWVRFQEIQHDVFIKIINIINANHAQCAFPTQTLFVENETQRHALTNAMN